MRILHTVEFYSPSIGGAQEVVRQVSERLASRGHDVTVATSRLPERTQRCLNGVRIAEFDVVGNAVRGIGGEVERYRDFLRQGSFDLMLNYAAQQWATDAALPLVGSLPYPAVLAPCGFSALHDPAYSDYFDALSQVMARYDHLVFHSNTYRDAEFARQHGLSCISVIPNGAAEEEFDQANEGFRARYGIPENLPLLLTVGSHTGVKGHRLVIEAFRRARIGQAVLLVVGNVSCPQGCVARCRRRAWLTRLLSFGQKRVLLLDPPRPDVVSAFQAADLFVFGSNIECSPIVLFEAMASGTPFITTACGNATEIVEWSDAGVVVPTMELPGGWVEADPSNFAHEIERLWSDAPGRQGLAENGRRAWRERFTWERVADRYEALYQSLLAS